jgi:ribonuclease BN (tRNA processing enzyme)
MEMTDETLTIRLPTGNRVSDVLLIRDAGRNSQGLLSRSRPFAESVVHYLPPSDMLPDASIKTEDGIRPLVHMGTAMATLMNGVFGDPLLHLRLRHQRRSLLFDLGDGARLPARIAHQVSDVFVSHAHVDHISGFLWLLRSRIGLKVACRLYGPAGLAGHIEGLLAGICWDRIGDRGPVFEVAELADNRLQWYRLQAGMAGRQQLGVEEIQGGVLLDEPGFQVRTAVLDHGIPVLAFAYEPKLQLNIRKERLRAQHLPPGPWLTRLKQHILRGDLDRLLQLPDGGCQTVATLADSLVLMRRGSKLVFATDFGDTADNRQRLTRLAKEAHVFFCEATFMQKHAAQAARTGHLTTAACARIANQAAVQYLVPFHFSRRYEKQPWQLYDEIAALTSRVVIPKQSEWSRMRENGS